MLKAKLSQQYFIEPIDYWRYSWFIKLSSVQTQCHNGKLLMKPHLISAIENELTLAKTLLAKGELAASFYHLERAHVIAQPYVLPHLKAHWLMLKVEFRQRRLIAVFGQAIRMLLGMIGSAVGVVPVGNTGGTNISMFKRLPIASELQNIIDGAPSKPL